MLIQWVKILHKFTFLSNKKYFFGNQSTEVPNPFHSSSINFFMCHILLPLFSSFFLSFLLFSILPFISPSVTDDTFSWESYLWQLLTGCHRHISLSIIVVNISFQPFMFDFMTTFVHYLICINLPKKGILLREIFKIHICLVFSLVRSYLRSFAPLKCWSSSAPF